LVGDIDRNGHLGYPVVDDIAPRRRPLSRSTRPLRLGMPSGT
jgi:hypothetical protein